MKPLSKLAVLDAGCGTGNYLTVMKHLVGECTGLDPNDGGMLQIARAKHGDDVKFVQGSALALPFEDKRYFESRL